ncbi:MAG: glutathione peroxidase [Ferruginibacter sp.]
MRKIKKASIILLILLITFFTYVEIVNRNSIHMSYRQKVLKAVYPAWMWWAKLTGKNNKMISSEKKMQAPVSFYSLKDTLIDGTAFDVSQLKGKKIMLVNTASECGYTNQYEGLQKLQDKYAGKLVVIGFPANDFKQQEKGTDEEIASFCKKNYGVGFPLMKKSIVIKSAGQNEIFQWLTDSTKNGWNNQPPTWNFCKYIVDENGNLTNFFESTVDPVSKPIIDAIQ